MACGCDKRRKKILAFFRNLRNLFRFATWKDVSNDANTDHLRVIKLLGLNGTGPAPGDVVEKKVMMYQQIGTWVIEYDAKTMNTISAKFRMDEYPL